MSLFFHVLRGDPGTLKLNVQHKPGKPTTDIDFSDPPLTIETSESEYEQNLDVIRNNQTTIHLIQGYTAQVEDEEYQKARKHVCCLWNHVPEQITLTPDQRFASYRFVMTVDELCSVAKQEITDGKYHSCGVVMMDAHCFSSKNQLIILPILKRFASLLPPPNH